MAMLFSRDNVLDHGGREEVLGECVVAEQCKAVVELFGAKERMTTVGWTKKQSSRWRREILGGVFRRIWRLAVAEWQWQCRAVVGLADSSNRRKTRASDGPVGVDPECLINICGRGLQYRCSTARISKRIMCISTTGIIWSWE
jgi:hypothetical protein